MIIYSLIKSDINYNIGKILIIIANILNGILIYFGIGLIIASITFFTIRSEELAIFFLYSTKNANNYPISIYDKVIKVLLIYFFPLSFINYFPALYIFNKSKFSFYTLFSTCIGILFIILTHFIWKVGLKHYKSTGS